MKKLTKIVSILMIMLMVMSTTSVFATQLKPNQIVGTASNGTNKMQDLVNKVVGILQTVGIIMSVAVLIVLGIKYMMGSAEEKAEYKKTMIPYLIGALFIFAASALAKVVYDAVQGI